MKRIVLLIIIMSSTTFSCRSVKMVDSWSAKSFEESKSKKILVIARSEDMDVRKAYENKLVTELEKNKVNAVSALKLFPNLKEKKNRSQEELDEILQEFKNSGIKGILLSALKNTKVVEANPEELNNTIMPYKQSATLNFSFNDYYKVNSVEYLTSNLRPLENNNYSSREDYSLKSTTYIIETVFYDLTLEKENQLVSKYLIEATDPNSASEVLNRFCKLISKKFKN